MEKEPLLPFLSPRCSVPAPSLLFSLPEENEISLPLSLTQSEFKDRLIFGQPEENEISLPLSLTPSELKDRLIFGPSSPPSLDPQSSTPSETITPTPKASTPSFAPCSSASFESLINLQDQEKTQSWLIDPNYVWKRGNLHRSRTAPAMAAINDLVRREVDKPSQFNSSSLIKQALVLLLVYLTCGVIIYWWNIDDFRAIETEPVVDAIYFCIVTMCTIGYGDITPNSTATKLFSILFVLVGFGFIDILLSGMVSYMLDLQENYLLKAVKEGREKVNPTSYIIDFQKGRMRIRMKVGLALGVVVLCIAIGAIVMHFVERLVWVDAFYLSVMSVTTVGYGDRAFTTMPGRIFASVWLLVSTLAVARAFLYLAEARVDRRHRRMAKYVLGQDMTISQFLAADIDNNGFVSKSEYVIYKLKEMGKVSEKDIIQICKTFERIDSSNCGKITLNDLMEGHH